VKCIIPRTGELKELQTITMQINLKVVLKYLVELDLADIDQPEMLFLLLVIAFPSISTPGSLHQVKLVCCLNLEILLFLKGDSDH